MFIPPSVYLPTRRKKRTETLNKEEQEVERHYVSAHNFATCFTTSLIGVGVLAWEIYAMAINQETMKSISSQLEKLAEVLAF